MKPSKHSYGFVTYIKEDGQYSFWFNDEAGRAVLHGREYQFQKSRDRGLRTLIRNAGKESQYESLQDKKGRHYFILKGGNQQEIGRSIPFEAEAEMKKTMNLLKGIKQDVPLFDIAGLSAEEAVEEAEAAVEKEPEAIVEAAEENPGKERPAEKLPRYKFSIIYYPDSDVWVIKHDQSGNVKQLKTCDGKQIELFLKAHLPAVRAKTTPTVNPVAAPPQPPVQKAISGKPHRAAAEELELKLRGVKGEEIRHFAKAYRLVQVEVLPQKGKTVSLSTFDATVTAKSMEGTETVVVAEVKGQKPAYGCFVIPIHGVGKLKPGMYRLSVAIHQNEEGEAAYDYQGSHVVILN